jgi:hypothetical protein
MRRWGVHSERSGAILHRAPFLRGDRSGKQLALDAGFTNLKIDVLPHEKTIPDSAAFARAMVFGNPLSDQIKERGGDPEKLVAVVLDDLRRTFGADPGRMPLQAIFYSARKPG